MLYASPEVIEIISNCSNNKVVKALILACLYRDILISKDLNVSKTQNEIFTLISSQLNLLKFPQENYQIVSEENFKRNLSNGLTLLLERGMLSNENEKYSIEFPHAENYLIKEYGDEINLAFRFARAKLNYIFQASLPKDYIHPTIISIISNIIDKTKIADTPIQSISNEVDGSVIDVELVTFQNELFEKLMIDKNYLLKNIKFETAQNSLINGGQEKSNDYDSENADTEKEDTDEEFYIEEYIEKCNGEILEISMEVNSHKKNNEGNSFMFFYPSSNQKINLSSTLQKGNN